MPDPDPLDLTPPQVRALHAALLAAFPTPSSLERMVRLGLGWPPAHLAAPGNLRDVVLALLQEAHSRGRVRELLDAAHAANPDNPALRAFCESIGYIPAAPAGARSLNNLALLLAAQGDYAAARPLLERTLAIQEAALGPTHPDTADSLNSLAGLLDTQGDPAAARPLYERALAIYEATLGPTHPTTATSLNNLAALLHTQGDYAAARPLYERALAIMEQALGPDHPDTRLYRANRDALVRDMDAAGGG